MAATGVFAALMPARFTSSGPDACVPEREFLTRMWAIREAALGAMLLNSVSFVGRRRVLAVIVGLSAAEAAVNLREPTVKGARRSIAVGSAVIFGALAGYGMRRV
ncbi:hypothetical protein BST20_20410 [Mycobacterium branderi]|uniref:DUF202 domain-containing protein n=2 Tax=Mycobacterium branderi TaxID=43348 RepID=A0A7I7W0Y9_9MYCO|nr:hypothetical protein BST20_20410 [Mycobacterium branderi]BBZ11206.1 hypothetical protein MBRA_14010 [Mycobacterium branderi]